MEISVAIGAIFAAICFVVILALWYAGALARIIVSVGKPVVKNMWIAYKFYQGPYDKCGSHFDELCKLLPDIHSLGVYYDDPRKVRRILRGVCSVHGKLSHRSTTKLSCYVFAVVRGVSFFRGWRCKIKIYPLFSTFFEPFQGRTEVRWRPGQETSLAPLCSNLNSFRRKCTVLKKVLRRCWDFSALPSDSAPGTLLPPRHAPEPISSKLKSNQLHVFTHVLISDSRSIPQGLITVHKKTRIRDSLKQCTQRKLVKQHITDIWKWADDKVRWRWCTPLKKF